MEEPQEEDTGQIEERIQALEKQLDGVRKRTRDMLANREPINESFTVEAANNLEKHKNSKLFQRFMDQEKQKSKPEPTKPKGRYDNAEKEPKPKPMAQTLPREASPQSSAEHLSPNRQSEEFKEVRFDPVYDDYPVARDPTPPGDLSYGSPVSAIPAREIIQEMPSMSSRAQQEIPVMSARGQQPPPEIPSRIESPPGILRQNMSLTSENELEGYSQHIPSDYGPRQQPPMSGYQMQPNPFMPPMYPPYFYPPYMNPEQFGMPPGGMPPGGMPPGAPQMNPMMMGAPNPMAYFNPQQAPGNNAEMQNLQTQLAQSQRGAQEVEERLQGEIEKMKNDFNDILYEKDIEIFNAKKAAKPAASDSDPIPPVDAPSKKAIEQLENERETAQCQIINLENEVRELKKLKDKNNTTILDLKTEKSNLQMELRSVEEQFQQVQDDFRDTKTSLMQAKKDHQLEMDRLQKDLYREQNTKEQLQMANDNLQQDYQDMEFRYKQEKTETNNREINQLKTKLQHAQRLLEEKTETYRDLQREYNDLLMDRQQRQEQPERVERPERMERHNMPDRYERQEMSDRYERPDMSDRYERQERQDVQERYERPERQENQKPMPTHSTMAKPNDSASISSALHWSEDPPPKKRAQTVTSNTEIINKLNNNLLSLQMEKERLTAENIKLPEHGKTIAIRNRKADLERELEILDTNIENIKTKLRNHNALH